jgi:hypothetical protein
MRLKLGIFLRRHSFPASTDRSLRDRLGTTFSQRSVRSLCAQHDVTVLHNYSPMVDESLKRVLARLVTKGVTK